MRRAFLIFASLLATPSPAIAWYDHTVLMDHVQIRLEREFPLPAEKLNWKDPLPVDAIPMPSRYYEFASLLLLQSHAAETLPSKDSNTLHELLRLGAEDPDHGMDSDLPDSADPNNDRKYMGGAKGLTSQGFRHMFWPGWNWHKPLTTFQIPPHSLGQAPDRIELLADEARLRFRKGDLRWAARILGWTLHYIQDLTQPFHTVELPSLKMVPWQSLFVWPPTASFEALLRETTRTITNYHWAYEGYVRHALLKGDASPFRECFEVSGGSLLVNSPRELALEVTNRSIARAHKMGTTLIAFVGTHLKEPTVSVPLDPGQVDVEDLLKNPAYAPAREALNANTCESLRLATDASIWITRWAFAR